MENMGALTTERRNERTVNIDRVDTLEMMRLINEEDMGVAVAVGKELPSIAAAVDAVSGAFRKGGRLIYMGAGTSGRLGVLDASECPPTFGVDPSMVVGIIAGGADAMNKAVEGAEDSVEMGANDVRHTNVSEKDVVVGIAASGRTPYVLGALAEAKARGAVTVAVSCSEGSKIADAADIAITPVTGPEALTGSTRLKAGTAQKLVLNMISTGSMIRIGKAYHNLMVDVQPTNEKLRDRSRRIVEAAASADAGAAARALEDSSMNTRVAIVMLKLDISAEEAQAKLEAAGGVVAAALGEV